MLPTVPGSHSVSQPASWLAVAPRRVVSISAFSLNNKKKKKKTLYLVIKSATCSKHFNYGCEIRTQETYEYVKNNIKQGQGHKIWHKMLSSRLLLKLHYKLPIRLVQLCFVVVVVFIACWLAVLTAVPHLVASTSKSRRICYTSQIICCCRLECLGKNWFLPHSLHWAVC